MRVVVLKKTDCATPAAYALLLVEDDDARV